MKHKSQNKRQSIKLNRCLDISKLNVSTPFTMSDGCGEFEQLLDDLGIKLNKSEEDVLKKKFDFCVKKNVCSLLADYFNYISTRPNLKTASPIMMLKALGLSDMSYRELGEVLGRNKAAVHRSVKAMASHIKVDLGTLKDVS